MKRTLLVILRLTPSCLFPASDRTHEGQEILDLARSKSDLQELPSFAMKATVKIENQNKVLAGEYALLWNGPNQWREEISFPGYDEILVGGPGTVALKRNLDFMPLRIYQLRLTLEYGKGVLTLRPGEAIKSVRTRKVNGIEAKCVEMTNKVNASVREICVDASSGLIVREHPFVDKEFAPVGAKIFPHVLSYIEQGKTLAEAEVTELKTTESLPSSAFQMPAGAVSKPSCLTPAGGYLIKKFTLHILNRRSVPTRKVRSRSTR